MKLRKILYPIFVFILINQLFILPTHAQEEKPNIAFLETEEEIHKHRDDFSEGALPIYVANTSVEEIQLEVFTLGIDILKPHIQRTTLSAGEVVTIYFSLLDNQIAEEKVYSGFLIFTSQLGDVIYKVININSRPKTETTKTADAEEISLLTGEILRLTGWI